MLEFTIISFFGTIITGFFAFRQKKTTITWIAKLFFYIFLFSFCLLLVATVLGSFPPPVREGMPAA